jgi:uncharacterized protein YjbJ (UPF0337 family)
LVNEAAGGQGATPAAALLLTHEALFTGLSTAEPTRLVIANATSNTGATGRVGLASTTRAPTVPGGCRSEENAMGVADKASNKAEELKGKGKEATGQATDDPELEAAGKTDQTKGNLKQAGEKVKDTFK